MKYSFKIFLFLILLINKYLKILYILWEGVYLTFNIFFFYKKKKNKKIYFPQTLNKIINNIEKYENNNNNNKSK